MRYSDSIARRRFELMMPNADRDPGFKPPSLGTWRRGDHGDLTGEYSRLSDVSESYQPLTKRLLAEEHDEEQSGRTGDPE